jgi:hypothetical protein
VVHSQAEARRYIERLIRQHNRRCERLGRVEHALVGFTRLPNGKTRCKVY